MYEQGLLTFLFDGFFLFCWYLILTGMGYLASKLGAGDNDVSEWELAALVVLLIAPAGVGAIRISANIETIAANANLLLNGIDLTMQFFVAVFLFAVLGCLLPIVVGSCIRDLVLWFDQRSNRQ